MNHLENARKLLEETGSLLRAHFRPLFATAAVVLLPVALLGFAVDMGLATGRGNPSNPAMALASLVSVFAALSVKLFLILPLTLVAGLLAQAAQTCQLQAIVDGRAPLGAKQSWKRLIPSLIPLLLTSILVAVLATVGMFFFVLPGLWVLYRGVLVAQVVVHEHVTGWAAFVRSGELAKKIDKGYWIVIVVFVVAGYLGGSVIDAIFPWAVASFLGQLLHVVLMPLPLTATWLAYRGVVREERAAAPGTFQTARVRGSIRRLDS